jgi:hypothetical protein
MLVGLATAGDMGITGQSAFMRRKIEESEYFNKLQGKDIGDRSSLTNWLDSERKSFGQFGIAGDALQGAAHMAIGAGYAGQDTMDYYLGTNTSGLGNGRNGNYNWSNAPRDLAGVGLDLASLLTSATGPGAVANMAGFDIPGFFEDVKTSMNTSINTAQFGEGAANAFSPDTLRALGDSSMTVSDSLNKAAEGSFAMGAMYDTQQGKLLSQAEALTLSNEQFQNLTPVVMDLSSGMVTFNDGVQANISSFGNISESLGTAMEAINNIQAAKDSEAAYTANLTNAVDTTLANPEVAAKSIEQTGWSFAGVTNTNEYTPSIMGGTGYGSLDTLNATIADNTAKLDTLVASKANEQTVPQSNTMQVEISVSGSDKNEIATEVIRRLQSENIIEGIIRKSINR